MYKALDGFLATETWHKTHAYDDQRFYQALQLIIRRPDFSAEKMRDYIRQQTNLPAGSPMDYAIDRLVERAGIIRDYLKATEGL